MVKVESLRYFRDDFKRLSKKFKSLVSELDKLIVELEKKPTQGADLGAGFYKIRLASASKGGGKSGGFRVLTYFVEQTTEGEIVYLVTIFDKSEKSSITKKELLKIVKNEFG